MEFARMLVLMTCTTLEVRSGGHYGRGARPYAWCVDIHHSNRFPRPHGRKRRCGCATAELTRPTCNGRPQPTDDRIRQKAAWPIRCCAEKTISLQLLPALIKV